MSLSAIPLPIRIVAGMLIGLLLFKAIGNASILLIIAAVLWTLLLAGLLYESGPLAALGGVPGLGKGLNWITNRTAAPNPAGDTAAEASAAKLSEEDRQALLTQAYHALDNAIGQEDARDLIETRLFEPARASTDDEPSFGTRAPAVMVVISGQRGLGAEQIARAIAKGYAGLGALKTAKVVELRSRDVRGSTDQISAVTDKAEEAIGGTLLMEDADWLLAPDPYGGGEPPGVEAGMALLGVAQANPQSFVIVATLEEGAEERLRQDSGHARWVGRLALRVVRLTPLEDEQLLSILLDELDAIRCPPEPDAERSLRVLIREVQEHSGAGFDNAEACRRIAEQLSTAEMEMALEDNAPAPVPGTPRTLALRHVQRVQDTWE
ncbi:MAG: hypothetical protein AAF713_05940 [Pseudomonadota bacterium]